MVGRTITPITKKIPVFTHTRRTPLIKVRERPLPPFPPLNLPSVTSAAFYRTLLKTGCRLLCLPRTSEKATLPRYSLLTLMIDHFDLIIGYDSIDVE